jgi:tRNA dimethylallyltransferase
MKIKKAEKIVQTWLVANPKNPLLIVLGPTASGKTKFSIALAKKFDGEIINADSRQIYKGLDIGSAPPTTQEMVQIPHHLVATFSPRTTISVAKYRQLAEKKIRDTQRRGKLPILAGGHTLLISAIVENFQFSKKASAERRAKLTSLWGKDPRALHSILKKIDPVAAKKIPAENQHHLIRNIERTEIAKKPKKGKRKFDCCLLGLKVEREKLYKQIDIRVDAMIKMGLLDEVSALAKKYERYVPALRGHGYREILDYLNGEKDLKTAIEDIKKNTRNYAKRQLTWWRNSSLGAEIHWI